MTNADAWCRGNSRPGNEIGGVDEVIEMLLLDY